MIRCETCRYDGMCIRQTHTMANVDDCNRYEEYKERPHGEWIEHRQFNPIGCFYSEYECSNCHDEVWQKTEWQFCPNCGSDNRKKEDKPHGS